MQALNKICFTICIVCIVAGVVLGLAVIWVAEASEYAWKGFMSVSVLFLGAALTMSISRAYEGRIRRRPPDFEE